MIVECFIAGSYWTPCEVVETFIRDSDGALNHLVRVWDETKEDMVEKLIPIEDVRI
jgi:hypothetical protein